MMVGELKKHITSVLKELDGYDDCEEIDEKKIHIGGIKSDDLIEMSKEAEKKRQMKLAVIESMMSDGSINGILNALDVVVGGKSKYV